MKRYDIYVARLEPVQGSEMGKTRPVATGFAPLLVR